MKRKELNKTRVELIRDTVVDHVAKKQPMNVRKLLDFTVLLNRILSDMEEDPGFESNMSTTVDAPVKYHVKRKTKSNA
jgi:aspartate carbamoyltransferase regulatory subunit